MTTSTFDLSGKQLKLTTAADAEPYVEQINALPNLEKIILSGNTIGVEASRVLFAALADKQSLQMCIVSDIFTGRLRSEIPLSLQFLTEALKDKKSLQELDLSDNAFGPDGLRPVVPLISALTSLRILKVNNTGLGPQGGELLAQALAGNHSECVAAGMTESNLEMVVCGRSRLENGSMDQLADALKLHMNLKTLVLPQDGIRPEGIVKLMSGLRKCRNLEHLDLQDNTFMAIGGRALADALPSWPCLKKLNVGDCMLTTKGAQAVFESLKAVEPAQKLELLNLQYNEINETSILFLASILPAYASTLKSLELNGNCFSEDGVGADAIRDALKSEDILGSLSDMEEEEEDDDEDDELGSQDEEDLSKGISGL